MDLFKIQTIFPEMKEPIRKYNTIHRNLQNIETAMAKGFDPNGFWELKTENESRSWTIVKKVGNVFDILRDYAAYNDYGHIYLIRLEDQLIPDEYADDKVKTPRLLKDDVRVYCGLKGGLTTAIGMILNMPDDMVLKQTSVTGNELTFAIRK